MIAVLIALVVGSAFADIGEERLEEAVVEHVKGRIGPSVTKVEVHHLGVDGTLDCPDEALLSVSSSPTERFNGHGDLRLEALSDGRVCWSRRVRVRVDVWVSAPVASRRVAPGELVEWKQADVLRSELVGVAVKLDDGPFEARVPLEVDQPITERTVRATPDGRSGDTVVLEALAGALRIEADARLLDDARLGDSVRVANLATGAVVAGVLIAPDRVRTGGAR